MSHSASQKRFTVSLDAQDYDALRARSQGQRPRLSVQYIVRLAIRCFLDEHEGRVITLVPVNDLAKWSKR